MNSKKRITIFTTDNPANRRLFKEAVRVDNYTILKPLIEYFVREDERFELWQMIEKTEREKIVKARLNISSDVTNHCLLGEKKDLFDKFVSNYWEAISAELFPRLESVGEVFPWSLFELKGKNVYALKYLSFPNAKKWIECLVNLAKNIAGDGASELNLVLHDGDLGGFYTCYDVYGLDENDLKNLGFEQNYFENNNVYINIISFKHTSNEIVKVLNEEIVYPSGEFYEKMAKIIKEKRDKGIAGYIKKASFSINHKTTEDPISRYWSNQS